MRLLHTSDWHLGQTLHQFDRSYEHQQFLAWLLDTLVAEQVDALLIAGDVFDNANPAAAAQAQFYHFLTEARRRLPQLATVVIAGNHDSAGRLEAPTPFLALLDAIVIGQPPRAEIAIELERIVVPLRDRLGKVAAWCIAMPFLRPGDVPRVEAAADPYPAGIAALYAAAYALACRRREAGQAIIAMGHCHLSGAQVSEDSERRIVIGGAEALPAGVFDPGIAYVALGHLHLAQRVGGDPGRRYSGSPLPMSFSEIDYPHQVLLVELDGERLAQVDAVPVPRPVELLRVPARPAPLVEALAALASLDLADPAENAWPYLQVRVRLDQPEPALRAQVEAALLGQPVRLARIETSHPPRQLAADPPTPSLEQLDALVPVQFFRRLYAQKYSGEVPPPLLAAFDELLGEAAPP